MRVHVYDHQLSCYLGSEPILELSRVYFQKGVAKKCINYRHLIGSLVKKPGAFKHSVLREDLLPSASYKEIWRLIDERCSNRHACKLIVGLLKLAADYNCEKELGEKVLKILKKGVIPSLGDLQRQYEVPPKIELPSLSIQQHPLSLYDQFHSANYRETCYA